MDERIYSSAGEEDSPALLFLSHHIRSACRYAGGASHSAFARKYAVNCTIYHTRVPGLNRTGELFLENGYQLLVTNDRDTIEKSWLGDLPSDRITNYPGFRLRGNFLRTEDYARQTLGPNIYANPEDRTEL